MQAHARPPYRVVIRKTGDCLIALARLRHRAAAAARRRAAAEGAGRGRVDPRGSGGADLARKRGGWERLVAAGFERWDADRRRGTEAPQAEERTEERSPISDVFATEEEDDSLFDGDDDFDVPSFLK